MARAVRWDLIADPRKFQRGFREAERTSDRLGKTIRRTASLIGGAFAAVQVAGFLKGAIDEAREAQKVGRQTAAVIKATGGVAKVSAKDVDRLSESLSNKVAVDDEIIAAGANMLLTFKGVRNEVGKGNDVFTQASSVILDMTAAMHQGEVTQQGLEKATIQVGKALNDPIRGITALTRVGVTFTQGQKDQIKALVEAGRAQDAQRIILTELRSEFGGAAAAAADTGKRLAVVWANIKERVGTLLLPAVDTAAGFITDKLIPAAERFWKVHGPGFSDAVGEAARKVGVFVGEFRDNLGPQLDRVEGAWNRNKTAILGFLGSLTGGQGQIASASDAARSFGDALVAVTELSGKAARAGDDLAGVLNRISGAGETKGAGEDIHENWVRPWAEFVKKVGDAIGIYDVMEGTARITSDALHESGLKTRDLATNTDAAATAADRHAAALRNQRVALDALKGAMRDEETTELDLRQAKLNVTTAQKRLNDLKTAGKQGSTEYAQAQLDLRRAQIDVRDRTEAYRLAQQKANAATAGAMTASQQARPQVARLGDAAKTGGSKAGDARIPWRKLGEDVSATYKQIRNKTANITANFGWRGLEVFRVGGGTGGGLKAFAAGGRIARGSGPTADDVLIRASRGETVVSARDSSRPEFQAWASQRGIPGFATGGRIPNFRMQGAKGFVGALGRWDDQVTKVLDLAASRFKRLAARLGNPAIQAFIRSTDPLPYVWGGAGPGGYDCSGLVSAVLGKVTGRGGGHGQRYFTTGSIHAGILGIKPGLGGILQIGVTPARGHMAGRYGGLGFEAESTRTGIKIGAAASRPESFARHFHLAKGGRIDEELLARFAALTGADIGGDAGRLRIDGKVLDNGGFLMPGRTLAINRTGRPEVVMPLGKLSAVFGDNLRSWVVPWLRRIAVGVERGSRPAAAGLRGGGRPAGAFRQAFKPLTAQQLNRLPDAARWAYVDAHGRPRPPAGFAWAEDHSLVPTSFWNKTSYDSGGWLMPGTTLAVNRTGRAEPVGIDEDRLARKIAAELAKVIPTTIAIRELQAGMNWHAGRMGQERPFR